MYVLWHTLYARYREHNVLWLKLGHPWVFRQLSTVPSQFQSVPSFNRRNGFFLGFFWDKMARESLLMIRCYIAVSVLRGAHI
jgi:hypothetical protein